MSTVNMKGMAACTKCPAVKARLEAYVKPVFTVEDFHNKQVLAAEKRAQIANKRNLKMKACKQHAAFVRERKANASTCAAMRSLRDDKRIFTALRRHAQAMKQKVTKA